MNRRIRISLIVLCAGLLLFGLARMAMIQAGYWRADKLYEELRDQSVQVHTDLATGDNGEQEITPQVEVDLEGLQATNSEVIGWLWIPDTKVNYPLLQGADNQKYLTRNYRMGYDVGGSIFMDYRNSTDFSDDNTILYGHNMKNGAMFGGLKRFADPTYLKDHPYIFLLTEEHVLKYSVFAAYKTESTSQSYARDLGDYMGDFLSYIASCAGKNLTELPDEGGQIITLSTCTSLRRTERFVIHGALVEEQPREVQQVS